MPRTLTGLEKMDIALRKNYEYYISNKHIKNIKNRG